MTTANSSKSRFSVILDKLPKLPKFNLGGRFSNMFGGLKQRFNGIMPRWPWVKWVITAILALAFIGIAGWGVSGILSGVSAEPEVPTTAAAEDVAPNMDIGVIIPKPTAESAAPFVLPFADQAITDPQTGYAQPNVSEPLMCMDLKNAAWYSPVQIFLAVLFYLAGRACFNDAKERGQRKDAYAAFAGAVIMWLGLLLWIFVIVPILSWNNSPEAVALVAKYYAACVILASLLPVVFFAITDGLDFTPVAYYLLLLTAGAVFFGTFGAIDLLFGWTGGCIIPGIQAASLIQVKQVSTAVQMTIFAFATMLGATALYGIEVRSLLKESDEPMKDTFRAFSGLIVYAVARIAFIFAAIYYAIPKVTFVFILLLLAGLAGASWGLKSVPRTKGRSSALAQGEHRDTQGTQLSWDFQNFQYSLAIIIIMGLGLV